MNTNQLPPPCPFIPPEKHLARATDIAGAVRFSELTSEKIPWLWPNRIPLGRLTLLVADPGLGKSLLALDIAARVTTGAPWPDEEQGAGSKGQGAQHHNPKSAIANPKSPGSQPSTLNTQPTSDSPLPAPGSVLLLTAEDDFADTVRPRLEALGADCNRILGISTVPGDDANDVPRTFALKRDLARLRNLLEAMPDCRLVVIDPISAYVGSSNADVQSLLHRLTTIARERGVAILIVSQLRKKDGAAVYRTMGNVAFIAASRSSWAICQDAEQPNKRLLLPIKNNLAPHVAGLSYTIETSLDPRAPTIHWSPQPVTESFDYAIAAARAAGRPDFERQHAMKWLKERLTRSHMKANDARDEAEVQGISYGTLRRAYRELGGKTVRKGRFPLTYWFWTLPGPTAQNPGGELCAAGDDYDEIEEIMKQLRPPSPSNKSIAASPTPK